MKKIYLAFKDDRVSLMFVGLLIAGIVWRILSGSCDKILNIQFIVVLIGFGMYIFGSALRSYKLKKRNEILKDRIESDF